MHDQAADPRQLNGAVQCVLAASGLDNHVVFEGRDNRTDALTSIVLMRVASLDGDFSGIHPLRRCGGEDADGASTYDRDAGVRADSALVAAVPCHTRRLDE
jgi:hypothetical protein